MLNKIGILKIREPRSVDSLDFFLKGKVSRIYRFRWPQVTLNRLTPKHFLSGSRSKYFASHDDRQHAKTDRHERASNPGTIF